MQEHGAATAGNARTKIVIDLDDEVVEVVLPCQPVAGLVIDQPDRLVVTAVVRIFAPGVFGPDGAKRQKCLWPWVAVQRFGCP